MAFPYLQVWRLHHLSGQSVPVLRHPHSEKVLTNVQSEPPVFQFVPLASCPGTGHHWEEPVSVLLLSSFMYVLYPTLSRLFSRLESQLPQPFLRGGMLQSLHHLCGPSLDSLQYVHLSPVLGTPALDPALQLWPHQCGVEGKDHLPRPAGNTPPDADQDPIDLLCSKGTMLSHLQLGVHQDPQVLSCQAAFQLGGPQHIFLHRVVLAEVQDFALLLVEPHEVPVSSVRQPVEVPVDGSTALWCVSHSFQFVSSAKSHRDSGSRVSSVSATMPAPFSGQALCSRENETWPFCGSNLGHSFGELKAGTLKASLLMGTS